MESISNSPESDKPLVTPTSAPEVPADNPVEDSNPAEAPTPSTEELEEPAATPLNQDKEPIEGPMEEPVAEPIIEPTAEPTEEPVAASITEPEEAPSVSPLDESPVTSGETGPSVISPLPESTDTAEIQQPAAIVTIPSPSFNEVTSSPQPDAHSGHNLKLLIGSSLAVLLIAALSFGSYVAGKHSVHPVSTTMTAQASLTVPAGATIIEKCEPGLGTQYILPKDIPGGPVYNVYQGKVIGVEYMAPLSDINKPDVAITNLQLFGQKFDHVNIMSMPAHGGMPVAHYQMDAMLVPESVTKQITCGGSSSTMSGSSMSGSSNMQSTPTTTGTTMPSNSKM